MRIVADEGGIPKVQRANKTEGSMHKSSNSKVFFFFLLSAIFFVYENGAGYIFGPVFKK